MNSWPTIEFVSDVYKDFLADMSEKAEDKDDLAVKKAAAAEAIRYVSARYPSWRPGENTEEGKAANSMLIKAIGKFTSKKTQTVDPVTFYLIAHPYIKKYFDQVNAENAKNKAVIHLPNKDALSSLRGEARDRYNADMAAYPGKLKDWQEKRKLFEEALDRYNNDAKARLMNDLIAENNGDYAAAHEALRYMLGEPDEQGRFSGIPESYYEGEAPVGPGERPARPDPADYIIKAQGDIGPSREEAIIKGLGAIARDEAVRRGVAPSDVLASGTDRLMGSLQPAGKSNDDFWSDKTITLNNPSGKLGPRIEDSRLIGPRLDNDTRSVTKSSIPLNTNDYDTEVIANVIKDIADLGYTLDEKGFQKLLDTARNPNWYEKNKLSLDGIEPLGLRSPEEQAIKEWDDAHKANPTLGERKPKTYAERIRDAAEMLGEYMGVTDDGNKIMFRKRNPDGSFVSAPFMFVKRDTAGGFKDPGYDLFDMRPRPGVSKKASPFERYMTSSDRPKATWYTNLDLSGVDADDKLKESIGQKLVNMTGPRGLSASDYIRDMGELLGIGNLPEDELRKRYPERFNPETGKYIYKRKGKVEDAGKLTKGKNPHAKDYSSNYDFVRDFVLDRNIRKNKAASLINMPWSDVISGVGKHNMHNVKKLLDEFGLVFGKTKADDPQNYVTLKDRVIGDPFDYSTYAEQDAEWEKSHPKNTVEKANEAQKNAALRVTRDVPIKGNIKLTRPNSNGGKYAVSINHPIREVHDPVTGKPLRITVTDSEGTWTVNSPEDIDYLLQQPNAYTFNPSFEALKPTRYETNADGERVPVYTHKNAKGNELLPDMDPGKRILYNINFEDGAPIWKLLEQRRRVTHNDENGQEVSDVDEDGNPVYAFVKRKDTGKYDPVLEEQRNEEAWDKSVDKYSNTPGQMDELYKQQAADPNNSLNKRLDKQFGDTLPNNPTRAARLDDYMKQIEALNNADNVADKLFDENEMATNPLTKEEAFVAGTPVSDTKKPKGERPLGKTLNMSKLAKQEDEANAKEKEQHSNDNKTALLHKKETGEVKSTSATHANLPEHIKKSTEKPESKPEGKVTKVTVKPRPIGKPGEEASKNDAAQKALSADKVNENKGITKQRTDKESRQKVRRAMLSKIVDNLKNKQVGSSNQAETEVSDARMKNVGHLVAAMSFRPGDVR